MSRVPLSSDETAGVFADSFASSLDDLGLNDTCRVWNRLETVFSSPTPPSHFIYEPVSGAEELEVIRVGGDIRIYAKIVEDIPNYDIVNLFYVHQHDYTDWGLYDHAAQQRVREIRGLCSVSEVEEFLELHNTLYLEDIRDIYDEICE